MSLIALAGQKLEMKQDFLPDGRVTPLTVVRVWPALVVGIKTKEKDGYEAVKLAFGQAKGKYNKKPILGEIKKATGKEKPAPAFLKEIRGTFEGIKVGEEINMEDVFKEGDLVQVSGRSKGRGFAGVMKRWGFHGGPRTHGQSDRPRAPGSIGQRTTPGRVYKGKKMAGRMGGEKVTVRGLKIFKIDKENNLLYITGALPGPRNGWLLITKKS